MTGKWNIWIPDAKCSFVFLNYRSHLKDKSFILQTRSESCPLFKIFLLCFQKQSNLKICIFVGGKNPRKGEVVEDYLQKWLKRRVSEEKCKCTKSNSLFAFLSVLNIATNTVLIFFLISLLNWQSKIQGFHDLVSKQ